MGILDDAIREHLDLKRRQGAADDELKRLEDEAFGPPQRPGDEDFPQTGEEALAEAPDEEPELARAAETAEAPEAEAALAEPPAMPADGGVSEEFGEEPAELRRAAETAEPPEREAPEAEAAALFDQTDDLDLDLEIDIEEEIEDVGEIELEETAPPEAEEGAPIESQPTVEHHFEDAIDEAEVVEEGPEEPEAEAKSGYSEEPPAPSAEGEEGEGEEDEDVLEETPEFLRDAPEDDELWFEQGEPKDFDF